MKIINIKKYILIILVGALFSACEDEIQVQLNSDATLAPTLSDTEVILDQENEGTDALTVSWPAPDYGFQASPAYYIYLDKGDGNFSAPIVINNSSATSKVLKVEELNRHLIALGFEPGVEAPLKVKVESKLGTYEKLESEVMTVNVTAYSAFLDLATTWGIVGSGFNNWGSFPDAPFFTTKTANELVAYVKLLDGQIKFRENNAWDNNLGDNGADGTLESGGADIAVEAGYYKVILNPVANTYSIAEHTWGIVGSAYNDWGATPDFPFTYDDATDQWRAIVKLKDGDMKIRKNNDWGLNYGDTGGDGVLDNAGDNIAVTAGKYLVTFNETDLSYSIEPIDAIWGLVGSSYNDWGATPDAQFNMDFRNEGVWYIKGIQLLAGNFKIRDDNSWGTNYGDNDANGSLELNGADITSEAGYYTITLNFSDPENPTITKVKH
jgi:hypothetical protein